MAMPIHRSRALICDIADRLTSGVCGIRDDVMSPLRILKKGMGYAN
ncbi:MAG: hypothetical protein ACYTGL_24365 [Planctomycetota bacterium]|jgi:hypothetical protein